MKRKLMATLTVGLSLITLTGMTDINYSNDQAPDKGPDYVANMCVWACNNSGTAGDATANSWMNFPTLHKPNDPDYKLCKDYYLGDVTYASAESQANYDAVCDDKCPALKGPLTDAIIAKMQEHRYYLGGDACYNYARDEVKPDYSANVCVWACNNSGTAGDATDYNAVCDGKCPALKGPWTETTATNAQNNRYYLGKGCHTGNVSHSETPASDDWGSESSASSAENPVNDKIKSTGRVLTGANECVWACNNQFNYTRSEHYTNDMNETAWAIVGEQDRQRKMMCRQWYLNDESDGKKYETTSGEYAQSSAGELCGVKCKHLFGKPLSSLDSDKRYYLNEDNICNTDWQPEFIQEN